jgi:putative transposase
LLVVDGDTRNTIPDSIKLIAGRTAQEYNQRKKRKGAFWEDRYHATAIQSDEHLVKCMTYIDLNMVRTGVVNHPSEWEFSGYNEIQKPRQRYRIIDYAILKKLFHFSDKDHMKRSHQKWVEEALKNDQHKRQTQWTQSIAVGDKSFIESVQQGLKNQIRGRSVIEAESGAYQLREEQSVYNELNAKDYQNYFLWE